MSATELRTCELGGCLPWPHDKMPTVAAERGLYQLGVGCNRLGCPSCGELVCLDAGVWRCRCLERRTNSTIYMDRQDHGLMSERELPWRCQGHPDPTPADLEALGFTDDVLADVRRLVREAPTDQPEGYTGYRVDVRLDLADAFDESAVVAALVEALDGDDDEVTHRAMRVLFHRDRVPLDGAVFRWNGFKGRMKPGSTVVSLGRVWSDGIARLARRDGEGSPAWEEAHRLRRAGAGGRNSILWSLFPDG